MTRNSSQLLAGRMQAKALLCRTPRLFFVCVSEKRSLGDKKYRLQMNRLVEVFRATWRN